MLRIHLIPQKPRRYRYLDSVHACIVAGLVAAGAKTENIIGESARPWTFACTQRSEQGGESLVFGLTISTADGLIAEALTRLDPATVAVRSSNGDVVDFGGSQKRVIADPITDAHTEMAFAFASPFAVMKPKEGREKTVFADQLDGIDLSAAFSAGLSKRAGRDVRLDVGVDTLSLRTNGSPRHVYTRKQKGRCVTVPAFALPLTLRGSADDLRLAFFAGVGAKTRNGFGCLITLR